MDDSIENMLTATEARERMYQRVCLVLLKRTIRYMANKPKAALIGSLKLIKKNSISWIRKWPKKKITSSDKMNESTPFSGFTKYQSNLQS